MGVGASRGVAGVQPLALALLVALAPACDGLIGDPGATDPSARPPGPLVRPDGSFVCNPDGAPSVSPLRRLSTLQYRNTISDLFGSALDAPTVAAAEIARIPVDAGDFAIMDARLSDQHVRSYYRIADRIAASASTNDATLRAIAGDCALDAAPSSACVDAFLDDFGMRAFRRPLSTDERAAYQALNDGSRDGRELFRALLFVLLQAPQFVYHVELDGDALGGDDNYYELAAYEVASRLSYHFWQSMPDEELFAAAADGSILTDAGYAAEVDRIFADPRTRTTIESFYREWWHVGWLSSFPDNPAFHTLAEGTSIYDAGNDTIQAMSDEIDGLTDHFTFESGGSVRDLLLTDLSFTQSADLAALYGVEPWDGSSANPHMPAGERAGILTRAAFLVNDYYQTHPIHRGATVRRRLLCDPLPQPDPTSLPPGSLNPPPSSTELTTRERFANKTANEPCATCHASFNPIGFVLERYDALGRFRTEEQVIDEATGEVLATLPVDSAAAPRINPGDDRVIDSGLELSEMLADSGRVESCFARQYFRFTFARGEGESDGCVLEQVRAALAEGGTLAEALRAVALDPSFRSRRVM